MATLVTPLIGVLVGVATAIAGGGVGVLALRSLRRGGSGRDTCTH